MKKITGLKERTLKSILEDPLISEISEDAISKWDLSKEDFYNWTLQEIADKKGWRILERGFNRLFDAASKGKYYYSLYSEDECADAPEKKSRNIVFLPSQDPNAGEKPFIFLVPGGGFVNVWSLTEGWPVADHFNDMGYNVFILTYQVRTEGAAVKALDDIARAMEIIKANKETFNVDPEKYITCGFSAGGYLVCLWNTEIGYRAKKIAKPQACFPIYPVTSFRIMNGQEWTRNIDKDAYARSSVGCTMEEACNSCFEIPLHADGFPPTAIFVAAEDELVDPEHSKRLAEALKAAGIPVILEIGPTGGHGFADGDGMSMEEWPERAIKYYENGGHKEGNT